MLKSKKVKLVNFHLEGNNKVNKGKMTSYFFINELKDTFSNYLYLL